MQKGNGVSSTWMHGARRRARAGLGCVNAAVLIAAVVALGGAQEPPARARAVAPVSGPTPATDPAPSAGSPGGAGAQGEASGSAQQAASVAQSTSPTTRVRGALAGTAPVTTPSSPALAAASAPSGLAPTAAGTYDYDTSGNASYGFGTTTFPHLTTLSVDPAQGIQQRAVRRLLDASGNGFVVDQTLDFAPDGIHLDRLVLTMTLHGATTVRTLRAQPPGMVLATGGGAGTVEHFDLIGSGIAGHEDVTIGAPGSTTVAGASVATIPIKSVLTLSGGASGTIEWDQAFAPVWRLPVREGAAATVTTSAATVDLHYTVSLRNLPA
ncbi:MAG: hypothetical protein JOZ68_01265 [Acidimicrobiia bacterium]|nr:hypothetical protein [Acidimicrobiia bacterium]